MQYPEAEKAKANAIQQLVEATDKEIEDRVVCLVWPNRRGNENCSRGINSGYFLGGLNQQENKYQTWPRCLHARWR